MSELLKRTTEETFAKRFQQLLKERKGASGLTLRELAKDLDVSLGILSDWQNGKKIPRMDSVIHLAQYFNVTTDYLLGLTDVRTTDSSARAAVEYTGLMEEAINYLHAPFRRAKTQSDVSWAENLHNRMSILIYSGVLEDLAEKMESFFDAVAEREEELMLEKKRLLKAQKEGKLYERVYPDYPEAVENDGKKSLILFKDLAKFPEQYEKFKEFVDAFDDINELAAYTIKYSKQAEHCDLLQFQMQKILTEEIQRTEKEAIAFAHRRRDGEQDGTDNEENE